MAIDSDLRAEHYLGYIQELVAKGCLWEISRGASIPHGISFVLIAAAPPLSNIPIFTMTCSKRVLIRIDSRPRQKTLEISFFDIVQMAQKMMTCLAVRLAEPRPWLPRGICIGLRTRLDLRILSVLSCVARVRSALAVAACSWTWFSSGDSVCCGGWKHLLNSVLRCLIFP